MAWKNTQPRPARAPKKPEITADSGRGRVLLALRAGRMTASEMNERFSTINPDLAGLCRLGLIARINDGGGIFYDITEAGRAACPLRNPLAAKVVTPREGAVAARGTSNTPATTASAPVRAQQTEPKTPSLQEEQMSKLQLTTEAIKAAIAGITKANAISREDLVSRANQTEVARSTLNKVFSTLAQEGDVLGAYGSTVARRFYDARTDGSEAAVKPERMYLRPAVIAAITGITRDKAIDKETLIKAVAPICDATLEQIADMIKRMAAEATVVGAEGQTAQRRYFDIRTLQKAEPPRAVVPADAKVAVKAAAPAPQEIKPKARPEAASPAVEFSVYSDGRLAIIDGDEILVLQPDDTRRLAYFLGCFNTTAATPQLLAA